MVDRLVNSEANARRIAMVESCFGTSGQPLNEPGRVLVGEGVLTKMCRKKPKPRQFFLFNDILVYGNIVLNKKKYNKQHIIPLEEVQLSSLEDDGQFRNGWLIKTPTKSFAVYAATATEKAEWMAHINKCVTDLLRKSGKKAAEKHAAVWVPDSETQVCMHCKKTQFTLINRRHHCRKCGKVVCGPCSSKKVILTHQSNKPLRVCLTCHDEMSSTQSQTGSATPINSMAGRMDDIISEPEDEERDKDSCDEEVTIALMEDPFENLGPLPPPRRPSRARTLDEEEDSGEKSKEGDLIDISCDLFGEPSGDQDDDAPPPTLWWDDIDVKDPVSDNSNEEDLQAPVSDSSNEEKDLQVPVSDSKEEKDMKDPVSGGNNEEDMKERNNDSSGDDDSDEDTDDPLLQSPQSATETMTFYEGGDASNGEAPSMLDASVSSAVDTTSTPDTSMKETTDAPKTDDDK
ncbi:pleckstrin homology domain-containing family F member 2-like isoform X4 [Homarus americanus]|uniref:pleckstrin homology domain-containing family F member 2-like isoform X4 n=1 Tax=Homarus americanus TaxID=6706 RepID=UPI001C47237E|nr:pleckstrin homology domain-containing family F member 2-like isoform X4 [Homarus americanus]